MRRSFFAPYPCLALVALLLLSLGLASSQPASAAPAQQTFGGDPLNPFPALFPELAELPAPGWLKEGLRVSYYGQSATIGAEGGGGAGYLQHDIVAMEPALVVVSSALYLDTGGGQVLPSAVFGAAFRPGYGDWWLNPAVLEEAEEVANDDLAVVRMPATIAGEEYQAVRFEYRSGDSVSVWMFEEKSGLLLYNRLTVGTVDDEQHSSAETYLVDMRALKLPWQAKRAPGWVKRGGELEYDGVRSLTIAGAPSGQFPEVVSVAIETARPRWSRYALASYLNGQPQGRSTRVCGIAQLSNALWLPAEALKANVRRPLIDRDPVTGIETYYTRGNGAVLVEERGPLHYFASTFDGRTGRLLRSHLETQIGVGTNVTDITLQ
jgi:hypothetical protein